MKVEEGIFKLRQYLEYWSGVSQSFYRLWNAQTKIHKNHLAILGKKPHSPKKSSAGFVPSCTVLPQWCSFSLFLKAWVSWVHSSKLLSPFSIPFVSFHVTGNIWSNTCFKKKRKIHCNGFICCFHGTQAEKHYRSAFCNIVSFSIGEQKQMLKTCVKYTFPLESVCKWFQNVFRGIWLKR